jgi:hypothetical protein
MSSSAREAFWARARLRPVNGFFFVMPIFLGSMTHTCHVFGTSMIRFEPLDERKWMVVIYLRVP